MALSLLQELLRRHPEMDEREATSRIIRGDVLVGTERVTKPGTKVREGDAILLKPAERFVSRAGAKLDCALSRLAVSVEGKVLIDAGAATGGFTDCLLARGAAMVYAVDVGRNQLAWVLRRDPRVRALDGTNAADLEPGSFQSSPHGAVCDLSVRSIRRVASRLVSLVSEEWLLALVKPQFEWREPSREFRGVVTSDIDAVDILTALTADLRDEGLEVRAVCPSAIAGRRGNREFFYLIGTAGGGRPIRVPEDLSAAVREGFA
jgi:23S rRNA (cytidine1920-2'-O)/16S rRNA (cytidine1409-2'-O)-methyltransferase